MGGKLDSFRVFAERKMQLAGPQGAIGMLVPSAFHANEGATGIRRLYLRETQLEWCLSFENRRKLFDIHASFKFALVVARRTGADTNSALCFLPDGFRADRGSGAADGLRFSVHRVFRWRIRDATGTARRR